MHKKTLLFFKSTMKCSVCNNALSSVGDRRPVSICRHRMCVACFTVNNSCPTCSVKTSESVEEVLDADCLADLKELDDFRNSSSRPVAATFRCVEHTGRYIDFYCEKHDAMLCALCAWTHLDHRQVVMSYPYDNYCSDVKKLLTVVENVENECREMRGKLEKCDGNSPLEVLKQSVRFVKAYGGYMSEFEFNFPKLSLSSGVPKQVAALPVFAGKMFNSLFKMSRDASKDNFINVAFERCKFDDKVLQIFTGENISCVVFTAKIGTLVVEKAHGRNRLIRIFFISYQTIRLPAWWYPVYRTTGIWFCSPLMAFYTLEGRCLRVYQEMDI